MRAGTAAPTLAEQRAAFWQRVRRQAFPPPEEREDVPPLAIRVEAIPPGIGIEAVRVWFGPDAWGIFLDLPLAEEQDPEITQVLIAVLAAEAAML